MLVEGLLLYGVFVAARYHRKSCFSLSDQSLLGDFLEEFCLGKTITWGDVEAVRKVTQTDVRGEARVFVDHLMPVLIFLGERRSAKMVDKVKVGGTMETRKDLCRPLFLSLRRMRRATDGSPIKKYL